MNLLYKYGFKPSKGLGQNFLVDKNALKKIIDTADLKSDDVVLEIGPGIGTLTKELAKKADRVIAVEKDKKMCDILKETLKDYKNIEVIQGDALKIFNSQFSISNKFPNFSTLKYKVVANIPYYITSPLIRTFLETENQPSVMVLMVQKEVAQRICAKPPNMSLLSVSVQFYATPKIISYVSKNCFWPIPKVDSAIIKIDCIKKNKLDINLFFEIVKMGFSQPRKQLVNNLAGLKFLNGVKLIKEEITLWLLENKIDPKQRAESLSVDDWINLTKSYGYKK